MTDLAAVDLPPFRLRASMNGIAEAPGKTWFFELAAAVIDADRCVRCGACVAACPTDSLGVNGDDLPYLVKMCTGCSLCWDFCPRGGLRYEATWLTGVDPAPGLGTVVERAAMRVRPGSKRRSGRAQDGGVVTAVLLGALEAGAIDGALVAREDPAEPWRGVPYLATTAEEILACGGSFYNQTLALSALDLGGAGLSGDARVALVGTPCEIEGIRALQSRAWRRGSSKVDAVVLTVALLCTKSFDYRGLMVQALSVERGIDLAEVGKVDVVHGRLVVLDRGGATLVDEPVKGFHGAALKGCDECADFLGRAADLSVGSVGSPDGWSSVLVRTDAGAAALERVRHDLEVGELDQPEALERLDRLDKKVAGGALQRPFEPDGALFIDFAEHLAFYEGTDRAPVWRGR
jgi:coenzyme F420 hydrogenase subunit beta